MKIMIVDDEVNALRSLEKSVKKAAPMCSIRCFTFPDEAFKFAENNAVDIAFLDMRMPGIDGLILARKLQRIHNRINIIFVTGYEDSVLDAHRLHASGYVKKPADPEKIQIELANLRYPVDAAGRKKIEIQTFGNFEIFVDDTPVYFRRQKAKEVLAYMVDKCGSSVTNKEVALAVLDKKKYDRSMQKYIVIIMAEMMWGLKEEGIDHIISKKNNSKAILPSKVQCDLYSFLSGDTEVINSFHGQYMSQYGWSKDKEKFLKQKSIMTVNT